MSTLDEDIECTYCQEGDVPQLLDRDGVLSLLSGEQGTWCHSYDIYWWPCKNPPNNGVNPTPGASDLSGVAALGE